MGSGLRQWISTLMLVTALGAAGCSTVELAYRNADWLAVREVEDYIQLSATQEDWLDARLERTLAWHCRSELPRLSRWLESLSRRAASDMPVTPGTLEPPLDEAIANLRRLGAEIAPTAAGLLADLDDAQVSHLYARMEERNAELAEEHLTPNQDQRVAERAERMEERLERWLGPLSGAQRERVASWAQALRGQTESWLRSRRVWQAEFREAMDGRAEPGFEDRVTELLVHRDRFWPEAHRQRMVRAREEGLRAMADLLALADPGQRRHLSHRLEDLAADLRGIPCA